MTTQVSAVIQVHPAGCTTPDEIDDQTDSLRDELVALGTKARLMSNEVAPQRTKAGEEFAVGALLVTIAASRSVLLRLVETLQLWLTRRERFTVTVDIDGDWIRLDGASRRDVSRLVDDWVQRHGTT